MTRLSACMLLLFLVLGSTATCFAADAVDGTDNGAVTISFTKLDGAGAIVIDGPRSTVTAKSVTFHHGDKTFTLSPCNNGIEMVFGDYVVQTKVITLREMPPVEELKVISIKAKPARLTPDNGSKTRSWTFLQIAKDVAATGNCRVV